MKCPKCQYTSFDYLDACKRCSVDLRDVRTLLQIIAVSPEERAPSTSPVAAREDSEAAQAPEAPPVAATEAAAAEPEEDLFEGLDFEDSFEDMVEHTSYEESGKEAPADADVEEPEEEGEDELLDLDFGELFGDKKDEEN